jgi:hypothetical protein
MSMEHNIRSLAFRWSNGLLHAPVLLLISAVLLAYLSIIYTSNHLSINTDTTEKRLIRIPIPCWWFWNRPALN